MKKLLLIILLCLFGTAYGQTIGYFRYDTSKFYTTKVGGRGSIDVTGNVKFTGLLPKSAGTDSVVVRDVNGNLGTTAKGAIGGIYTASNGLTMAANNVKLGGTIIDTTTITQTTFPIYYTLPGVAEGEFTRYTNLGGTDAYVNFYNLDDGSIDLRFYSSDGSAPVNGLNSFIDNFGNAGFNDISTTTLAIRKNPLNSPTPQISIIAPSGLAGNWGLTLPTTDGNNLQLLQTNGSGVTTWVDPPASGLTVGTTTITSGTDTRVLYNNAGTLGEYTVTGTGNVAMSASPTFTGTINAANATLAGNISLTPTGTDNRTINWGAGYDQPAAILYDGGAGARYGWGLRGSEMQFFIVPTTHFSWNTGGDFQTSGTNELMRLNSTGNLGIGTITPNASAKLDITSTTQGVLMPRMTATQGSAITGVDGLIIYVTDTNGTFTSVGFWGYEAGAWVKL